MKRKRTIVLSELPHTWLIDIDGTLAVHNGYKDLGEDMLLETSLAFLREIPEQDVVVFLTSRTEESRKLTETFLQQHRIQYDYILYGLPIGERILINDSKPSGLDMAYAINIERNQGIKMEIIIDNSL